MPWNASKSVRVCHGGLIAGVNAWTNGCMSVVFRSCFSYQVAAGSTTSENSVVEVIRKSSDSSRSSLPSGASSCQTTSCGPLAPAAPRSARRDASVPSRWRRKYSLPLADEPSRLARHTVSTRGQFCGASGSVQANPSRPSTSSLGDVRGRVVRVGGERLVGEVERVAVEGRHRRHPAQPRRLGQQIRGVPAGELALGQRRGQHVGGVLVVAPLVGVQVPERGADHLPRRAGPVQAERQVRPAGDRAALLLPDVVRPAAAVDALAAGQRGQRQHRPVGGVGVEPVVGARAHQDHRPAAGAFGVVGELARRSGPPPRPARR